MLPLRKTMTTATLEMANAHFTINFNIDNNNIEFRAFACSCTIFVLSCDDSNLIDSFFVYCGVKHCAEKKYSGCYFC